MLNNEKYFDFCKSFIGKILDSKYQIQHLIGKGKKGNVYQATYLRTGATVAVKIPHQYIAQDPEAVERFKQQAYLIKMLVHPNAIQIMDFGVSQNNVLYFVMEFIKGVSLQKIIEKEIFLSPFQAVSIIKQTCLALDLLHQNSIIREDLKTDNILVINKGTSTETVKINLFSVPRYIDRSDTPTGHIVGIPEYISPEHAQGIQADHRANIYNLGCILYQILTGRVPFQAKTGAMTLMKHIAALPEAPRQINPRIPIALEQVILKTLAKDPNQRHQNLALLVKDLQSSLT